MHFRSTRCQARPRPNLRQAALPASINMTEATETYEPSPLPPPLLSHDQLQELSHQGHIPIALPPRLQNVLTELHNASQSFFKHDRESKQKAHPNTQGTELGYYHVEDEKEYLTLRHAVRANDLEEDVARSCQDVDLAARQLWRQTAALMHRAIMDISNYTSIEPASWRPVLDGCLEMPADLGHTTPTLLRLFRYEPNEGVAGEHTDNGLLTLCVGAEKGLQVWRKPPPQYTPSMEEAQGSGTPSATAKKGHWEDVQGPTLLAGTFLRILTTGRVTAGKHRVVSNPIGRTSIVFALRPSIRHHLDLTPFGGEGTWDLKRLWERILSERVNVNANAALRKEQQRKRDELLRKARGCSEADTTAAPDAGG